MRILFVINSTKAKFPVDLAKHLERNGCTMLVFPLLPENHGTLNALDRLLFVFRLPFIIGRLRRTIASFSPEVIHTHFWLSDIIGALAAKPFKRVKLVSTQHDEAFMGPLIKIFKQRALRQFSTVIAISKSVAAFVETYLKVPSRKISTIYNGILIEQFATGAKNGHFTRPAIGLIARLEPIKGGDIFIRALRTLAQNETNLPNSIVVGDGSERKKLEALVVSSGLKEKIRFLGEQTDIAAILGQLDVVVVPSRSEGLSITILEALAAGKLVVATNVGGIPELIKHGETGILVEPGDVEALAETLRWVTSHAEQARTISAEGNKWLLANRDRFDIDRTVASYTKLYERL